MYSGFLETLRDVISVPEDYEYLDLVDSPKFILICSTFSADYWGLIFRAVSHLQRGKSSYFPKAAFYDLFVSEAVPGTFKIYDMSQHENEI